MTLRADLQRLEECCELITISRPVSKTYEASGILKKLEPHPVLVFPTGRGSTVGSYTLYRLKHNRHAPLAILNRECETITAVGCIIAEIPCVDLLPIQEIQNGDQVQINGEIIEIG